MDATCSSATRMRACHHRRGRAPSRPRARGAGLTGRWASTASPAGSAAPTAKGRHHTRSCSGLRSRLSDFWGRFCSIDRNPAERVLALSDRVGAPVHLAPTRPSRRIALPWPRPSGSLARHHRPDRPGPHHSGRPLPGPLMRELRGTGPPHGWLPMALAFPIGPRDDVLLDPWSRDALVCRAPRGV